MARWTEAENEELLRLYEIHGNKWTEIAEQFSTPRTAKQLHIHYTNYLAKDAKRAKRTESPNPVLGQIKKRLHSFNSDGSETDVRVIPEEALQDRESLLRAHHYNPSEFELVNSTSNYWDMSDSDVGIKTLYQSKVTVKPKRNAIDWEAIGERLAGKAETRELQPYPTINSDRYLTINLFDLHLGNMTLDDYAKSLDKINRIIRKGYKEILIISGGDLLNENDYRGQTAKGTNIGKTNMEQAWEDAFDLLDMVIHAAIQNATAVNVMYIPGNHDEYSGSTVIKALRRVYSNQTNVSIDHEQKTFKATLLGHNFIGATHGDKANKKRYPQVFATLFSQLWGAEGVYTREMFSGHLHNELVIDDGLLMRQMPTRNHLDEYHLQNGFVTAHRRLQLVEYSEYETEAIYYA